MLLTDIVIVTCGCGTLPLNTHRNSSGAWLFAAAHVAKTERAGVPVCTPVMVRDTVPAALAPAGA